MAFEKQDICTVDGKEGKLKAGGGPFIIRRSYLFPLSDGDYKIGEILRQIFR